MDSGRRELAAATEWADLPAELLTIIYSNLTNCRQIIRFRSVCRWWRSSTPPPPNKLSGIFPLKPSFLGEPDILHDFVINASAVYLVRSRSDPSKACMVSVQEASAGNLVLRHPLLYKQIFNPAVDVDWILKTQTLISRSYAHNGSCLGCNQVGWTNKVAFVRESSSPSNPDSGSSQLFGLCEYHLFAFKMELSDSTTTTIARKLHHPDVLQDFETFNGRIFAIDFDGHIYLVDHTSLELIQMNTVPSSEDTSLYFVVSDGDLYLVSLCFRPNPPTCEIYRLQLNNHRNEVSVEVEKVEDLGDDDRVFFIGMTSSFSVSARHLPPPWKGNCVVFGDINSTTCECKNYSDFKSTPHVFILGGDQNPQFIPISSLKGYSDLFSHPAAAN